MRATYLLVCAQTFVFETREDYDFMMKTLNDNKLDGKQLRINGAELKAGKHSRSAYPNRYNADQVGRSPPSSTFGHD